MKSFVLCNSLTVCDYKLNPVCVYLLLLQSLLCRVDVLLYGHVDELVLSFGLDHARSLLTHSLNGLWDVNITIQP